MKNFKKFYLKKAEIFYSQEVSLPIYYGLSKKKQVRVINHIKKFTLYFWKTWIFKISYRRCNETIF